MASRAPLTPAPAASEVRGEIEGYPEFYRRRRRWQSLYSDRRDNQWRTGLAGESPDSTPRRGDHSCQGPRSGECLYPSARVWIPGGDAAQFGQQRVSTARPMGFSGSAVGAQSASARRGPTTATSPIDMAIFISGMHWPLPADITMAAPPPQPLPA